MLSPAMRTFIFSLCSTFFSHLLHLFYSLLLEYSDGCCLGQCLHHVEHNKIPLQNIATSSGTRVESRTADFTHMVLSQWLSVGSISVWLRNYIRTCSFELSCFLKYLDLTGHSRFFSKSVVLFRHTLHLQPVFKQEWEVLDELFGLSLKISLFYTKNIFSFSELKTKTSQPKNLPKKANLRGTSLLLIARGYCLYFKNYPLLDIMAIRLVHIE